MLAGNLASIGVGGIIAVVWSYLVRVHGLAPASYRILTCAIALQKPEHFDFDVTRAINKPHHHGQNRPTDETAPADRDSSDEKAKSSDVDDSESDIPDVGRTDDSDLDPVGLNKAFNFAVWSSVALVRLSISYINQALTT